MDANTDAGMDARETAGAAGAATRKEWLTAREVRAVFGFTRKVVSRGVAEGRVRTFRLRPLGGSVWFSRSDIEAWTAAAAQTGAEAVCPSMRPAAEAGE